MLRNPYCIDGPALVSFSGGRTSGYMLWHILDAHGGKLPDDVHVVFFNTGKEMPQTLEFVAECGERWGVKIVWLEYDHAAEGKTRAVNFSIASRNGEPFEALIRAKNFLPNPVTRHCTSEMKVKRGIVFMRDWCGYNHWDNAVGLRADERGRVAKQRKRNDTGGERFETIMPLAEAGVTKEDVAVFWDAQEFDLKLKGSQGVTPLGNCDLCFLKGGKTIEEIIRHQPGVADWWIRMETIITDGEGENADKFRVDRPTYARMAENIRNQVTMPFIDDEALPCFCTD